MAWTAQDLLGSVTGPRPPEGLSALVVAMWWQAHGDWDRAHQIAQELHTDQAAWVHAFLHRAEGDQANARYWYRQAGQPVYQGSLQEEWASVVEALLQQTDI